MANIYTVVPISQEILATSIAPNDVFPLVDVNDRTQSPSGTTKKASFSLLQSFVQASSSYKTSCFAASTANLVATYSNGTGGIGATLTNATTLAAFAVDGQTPAIGDRILIKNQSAGYENGIYTVTNTGSDIEAWVLTRASDYDQSLISINQGDIIGVTLGSTQARTLWFQTAAGPFVVGTTSIVFQQSA
jgi:hypothetical protein